MAGKQEGDKQVRTKAQEIARREFLKVGGRTLAGVALIGLAGTALPRSAEAAPVSLTFNADTSYTLRNPERGWFYDLLGNWNTNEEKWHTGAELAALRDGQNVTLFRRYFLLDDYLNQPIPQTYLDKIEALFNNVRNVGCKIIPRFRYIWNTETLNRQDASLSRIQQHMDQVMPIVNRHVDVVDHVQAGWVGYWGEWHTSSSGHILNGLVQPSGVTIAREMLARTPKNRQVAFRYPRHVRPIFGNTPPALSEAYSGTDRSRVGFHNDGFSKDSSSWNTFTQTGDREYVRNWGLYSIQTGEPAWDNTYSRNNFYNEVKWFGCHSMNMNQPDPNVAGLYTFMKGNGQHNDLHRYLGYRYRLETASVADSVKPGEVLPLSFTFRNDGWARSHNERRLVVVLRHKGTGQNFEFPYTEKDVRLALPAAGASSTIQMAPTIPAAAPEGAYDIILWLPDPYPSLRNRPEYAIRLANVGLWEAATGFNVVYGSLAVGTPTSTPMEETKVFRVADDRYVERSGNTYSPTGTPRWVVSSANVYALRTHRSGTYYIRNAFARFPVSIPAGATITSKKLRFFSPYRQSADARNLMADVFNWTGISSDHTSTPPTTNIAFSTPIANIRGGRYTTVNLSDVVDTSLRNGSLKLRFHISGGVPGGHNIIEVAAQESVNRMQLVVTYTV